MHNKRSSTIYTVGHSNGSFENFARLLELHQIQVIADVRSYPFSKYNKQFDTDNVRLSLRNIGLLYVFLGRELGGMPKGEQFYDENGHVVYARIAATPGFARGMERLLTGKESYTIALMCGEEDPSHCHRRLMLGRALEKHGVAVQHVRGDGSLNSEQELKILESNQSKRDDSSAQQLSLFAALS